MSKRWFTPSFEACETASASTCAEKTTSSKQRRTKSTRSDRCKTGGGGGGDGASSRRRLTGIESGAVGVDLLSKYEPETPDDLVVHAKKIHEVRAWISDRIANGVDDGKYVLLHGPSGCGKSTTFRVLAKSLNVKVIEWITPLDREWLADDGDRDDRDGDDRRGYFRGGGAESFDNFLWRASRYSCLGATIGDAAAPSLKIILVKDFPHSLVQNAHSFHDILRKYRHYNTYPMAFVCNDDLICRNLFPDNVRSECRVHAIAFNAVNCTAVTKALKRVLEMERRLNPALVTALPNDVSLQTFHQQSAGDLRSALLKFYFSIIKRSSSSSDVEMVAATPTTSNSGANAGSAADAGTVAAKDQHALDVFKIIGRILYCKTEPSTPSEATQLGKGAGGDDGCHTRDYKFVHDPDQLVRSMVDRPTFFAAFLQENYVSRFQDVVGVAAVADAFCVADVIFQHCRYKEATSDVVALNGVVRRLMVSNRRPKKSFAPFVAPKVYDSAETFAARFSRSLRAVSPHFQFSSSELVTHVLPFARVIPSADFQPHLRQFATAGGDRIGSSLIKTARFA